MLERFAREEGLEVIGHRAYALNFSSGQAAYRAMCDNFRVFFKLVEPFLLKIGYIVRSPNGRRATPAAYAHLDQKLPVGPGGQTQLPL